MTQFYAGSEEERRDNRKIVILAVVMALCFLISSALFTVAAVMEFRQEQAQKEKADG
jgi:hypothetical protein